MLRDVDVVPLAKIKGVCYEEKISQKIRFSRLILQATVLKRQEGDGEGDGWWLKRIGDVC